MIDLPNKKLLCPDEVAAFWRVSVSTIYRWVDLEIMDGTRRGGKEEEKMDRKEIILNHIPRCPCGSKVEEVERIQCGGPSQCDHGVMLWKYCPECGPNVKWFCIKCKTIMGHKQDI